MNHFFRTAYATTLVYLCLTLFGVLITGIGMPFLAFSCLYFGLLLFLLPDMSQRLTGKERLFHATGAVTAMLGFLPIALWRCPMLHWLIHLSGIAAAVAFLSMLRHRTTHRLFLAKYKFTAAALILLTGFVCLIVWTDFFQGGHASLRYEAVSLAMNGAVPYAIVLLASGVLLLRGLRAQPGKAVDEQTFNRLQLRDTLIFAILVTLVFAVDPFAWLGKAMSFLLNEVLLPFSRFLASLLGSLLRSMSFGNQPAGNPPPMKEAADIEPLPRIELPEMAAEYTDHTYQQLIEEKDTLSVFANICAAAAVLILLIVLAFQLRKLAQILRKRTRYRGSGYPSETCEILPKKKEKRQERKPKKRNSDPRERMRYLYGEFLRCLHKRRVQFGSTNTCGEIRRGAEKQSVADPSVLSDFTALYEKARYRMAETPAEADARVMKDLFSRIRKKP